MRVSSNDSIWMNGDRTAASYMEVVTSVYRTHICKPNTKAGGEACTRTHNPSVFKYRLLRCSSNEVIDRKTIGEVSILAVRLNLTYL